MKLAIFKKKRNGKYYNLIVLGFCIISVGCKKLVSIGEPINTVTTTEAFSTSDQANSAIAGIYSSMINQGSLLGINFFSGSLSIYCGMSADELVPVTLAPIPIISQFQNNTLQFDNLITDQNFWAPGYTYVYSANAAIETLPNSTGVDDSTKNELIGEAKFIRAMCYFYLVNLFGDVPLVTTNDWHKTNLLPRTSAANVYQQIISDLKDAQKLLPADYSVANGRRVRPNKWAATALLARVYLYTGDWADAAIQASSIIANTGLYRLEPNLGDVFLVNSMEAIWQLKLNAQNGQSYNITPEGSALIPYPENSAPQFGVSNELLNAFETGDQRYVNWVNKITTDDSSVYYIPYKYKAGPGQSAVNGTITEYYTAFRLAEQYLIRAEAYAKGGTGDILMAIDDLNAIRARAQLTPLPTTLTKDQVLDAIVQERRVELFAEWGHRWFDLKRTNRADPILGAIKSNWKSYQQLYPIPTSELYSDPNLTQNAGYN